MRQVSTARLRTPSDLRREGRGGWRGAGERIALSWPTGFAGGAENRSALMVLLGLASLTPRRLLELAAEVGSASWCLAAVRAGRAGSEADRSYAMAIEPADVIRRLDAAGARLVAAGDPGYPPSLLDLFDPPAGLFVSGPGPPMEGPVVAMVGARNCTPAGRDMASALAAALARAGACVVSGGARGIDAAAHEGALGAGGRTVVVLGSGIDVAYPKQNRGLLEAARELGAVVSEYPPGTPAEPFRFPARNRIVAALAAAVVVVEGAEGSGSMITADHALEMGRDVLAVPGAVTGPLSWVTNALIREGAGLIRGPEDLLADLGLDRGAPGDSPAPEAPGTLGPEELAVWNALVVPSAPDALARAAGRPLPEVMAALLALELRQLVRQVGGRYERRLTS
jgi:DNA processing protein